MDRRLKVGIFGAVILTAAFAGHIYNERKVEIEEKAWGYVGKAKDSKGGTGILEVYLGDGVVSKVSYDEICYPESEYFGNQRKKGNEKYNIKMKEKSGISWDEAAEILVKQYVDREKIDDIAGATGTVEVFRRISKKIDKKLK